jgi:hypothetical protein
MNTEIKQNIKVFSHTVPGTGTRFTCSQFLGNILGLRRFHYRHKNKEGFLKFDLFMHSHAVAVHSWENPDFENKPGRAYMSELYYKYNIPVIGNLRDPYLAWISRSFNVLEEKKRPEESMRRRQTNAWRNYINFTAKYGHKFLCVDIEPDRRKRMLESLIDYIGVEPVKSTDLLIENWPVVGGGDSPEKQEYLEFGTVHGEKLDFLDFAVEWYENKKREI